MPDGGTVLDVACGYGRHMRWFAARGHPVTGVDRLTEAISSVADLGETVVADIENGPWPFAGPHASRAWSSQTTSGGPFAGHHRVSHRAEC